MTPKVHPPNKRLTVERLTSDAFSPFGTVIRNPSKTSEPGLQRLHCETANQGSALKYVNVSHLTNHYDCAPSGVPGRTAMNMFVCSPRKLQSLAQAPLKQEGTASRGAAEGKDPDSQSLQQVSVFAVRVLERHPFTSQTFIPLGLSSAGDDSGTTYLVIVAPTLPASGTDGWAASSNAEPARPSRRSTKDAACQSGPARSTNPSAGQQSPASAATPARVLAATAPQPKGRGHPDLDRARAFVADGSQAVTYGPGTWHAPMVVLGVADVDFVVLQYTNGIALEDCQEIDCVPSGEQEGLVVVIPGNALLGGKQILGAKL